MKKYILFFVIFLFCFSLNSLELLKEVKLERVDNQPYSSIYSSDYDLNLKQLLILTPLPNIISNTQAKVTDKTFKGIFMFSDKGKFLGKVGKFNSHDKNGIIAVWQAKIIGNKINIKDADKKTLTIFSAEKPFKYLYSVKNILPDPWFGQPDFVKDSLAFFLQTRDNVTDVKSRDDYFRRVDQYKKTAFGKIIDTDDPDMKTVTNLKRIFSYKKFFDMFWNDKKLMKNRVIKKYLKKWKKTDSKEFSLNNIGLYGNFGPFISLSKIILPSNSDNFYVTNSFGTDIKYYNLKGTVLDSFKIKKYEDIKLKEMESYKKAWIKEFKYKRQIKKFTSKHSLSFLIHTFYDEKNRNIILSYVFKNEFLQIVNLPKAKEYLLVYSLDKRKAVSDFIPINFTPIQFDSEKRELIGTQWRDGNIYLQFYKWKY